jgi:aspartyl-tRNA(Asn)/glutamyl-tRNA(Gln) amidotransferase subunit B
MAAKQQAKSNRNLIAGATGDWEVIIGLEVHAQVNSKAKLFSGASTAFGGAPNSHVSLVDAAMPGMLPVINKECVAQAIRSGVGLKAKINLRSTFDRKNYFYPDLPQGYQISQYKQPIVGEGEVEIDVDGETKIVGIERLHLEQDAGKSIHDMHPEYSYVDLNRSGVALMEIVSRPDMRSAKEAQAYVTKLRTILRYLGTCDGDMEKGNLRADVNVSVRRPGEDLGTRCEIKNVNSIRGARSTSSRTTAKSIRKLACSTPALARPVRCARRKRRTTTATSPTPTSCLWSLSRPTSMNWQPAYPSCRTRRNTAS